MDSMSFRLCSASPRLGEICRPDTSHIIHTPALVAHTRHGLPTHLTSDVAARLPIDIAHTSLEHFLDTQPPTFAKAPMPLRDYLGLKRQVIIMGARDPADHADISHNKCNALNIRTNRGVFQLDAKTFAQHNLENPPDILIAMADEPVHRLPGQNRLKKSLARSTEWLETIIKTNQESDKKLNIFASLVGGNNSILRKAFSTLLSSPKENTTESFDDHLSGYYTSLTPVRGPSMHELLSISFSPLSEAKLRIVAAPRGPHEILRLITLQGIDLFIDSYSAHLSSIGVALKFSLPSQSTATQILASSSNGTNANSTNDNNVIKTPVAINLYDPEYALDFDTCLEQAKPTTSNSSSDPASTVSLSPPSHGYVHHLLHTHEMTAHVLLAISNTIVMDRFMNDVRHVMEQEGIEGLKQRLVALEHLYEDPSKVDDITDDAAFLSIPQEIVNPKIAKLSKRPLPLVGVGDIPLERLPKWERDAIKAHAEVDVERGSGPSSRATSNDTSPRVSTPDSQQSSLPSAD